MNRAAVLFHLREAAEQLSDTIRSLEGAADYGTDELRVEMGHLYHHLNTAWNGREQTDEEFNTCTDESFKQLRRFPPESELFLD